MAFGYSVLTISNLLRAEVINIDSAVVSACGRTVSELEASLAETIEIYRADCVADGGLAEAPKTLTSM